MRRALSFAFFVAALAGFIPGAEGISEGREIEVEEGMLSVRLDRVPAGEVFHAIAREGGIAISLHESLAEIPLTAEFKALSLEEGLRRLISQLRTDNFLMSYDEEDGRPELAGVDILAPGGEGAARGLSDEKVAIAAEEKKIPKGVQKQMERGLNPGQKKRYERTGQLPRSAQHVPEGLLRKMERGEPIPPGARIRLERVLNF